MPEARLVIPLIPPSVNRYVRHTRRGTHYCTREATAFREAVVALARGIVVEARHYEVSITIYLGKGDRGDVDNFCKLVLDALAYAGVIRSDADVADLHVAKRRDRLRPRTEIIVIGISGFS
jgi:Holliday junction resolvase RusA-like endonuclease